MTLRRERQVRAQAFLQKPVQGVAMKGSTHQLEAMRGKPLEINASGLVMTA